MKMDRFMVTLLILQVINFGLLGVLVYFDMMMLATLSLVIGLAITGTMIHHEERDR